MTDRPAGTRPPRRRLGRLAGRAFRYAAALYLAVMLMMSLLERQLVYPAPPVERSDWSPAASPGPDAPEDVWIPSSDGVTVHGWCYDRPDAERALLYCHGNGEQVADNHELMQKLRRELTATVLIFDYRGYGKTRLDHARNRRPRSTERGVYDDGLAAQRWLAERTGRRPEEVIVIGRSLGGGIATTLAAEAGVGALVLQDTFTSLPDAASSQYPWLPVRWLMANRMASEDRLRHYAGPLLVSHGQRDRVVPHRHGRRLYEACPSPNKRFLSQPDRGHEDPQPKAYYDALLAFLGPSVTGQAP